jgi:hypothetical protein
MHTSFHTWCIKLLQQHTPSELAAASALRQVAAGAAVYSAEAPAANAKQPEPVQWIQPSKYARE